MGRHVSLWLVPQMTMCSSACMSRTQQFAAHETALRLEPVRWKNSIPWAAQRDVDWGLDEVPVAGDVELVENRRGVVLLRGTRIYTQGCSIHVDPAVNPACYR